MWFAYNNKNYYIILINHITIIINFGADYNNFVGQFFSNVVYRKNACHQCNAWCSGL